MLATRSDTKMLSPVALLKCLKEPTDEVGALEKHIYKIT